MSPGTLMSYALLKHYLRYKKHYRYTKPYGNQQNIYFYSKTFPIFILLIFLLSFTILWCILLRSSNVELKSNKLYENIKRPDPFYMQSYIQVHETNESNLGMIHNESDRLKKEIGFQLYSFNSLVSERLGFYRHIPDTRHELCHNQTAIYEKYINSQYNTSVIICFFNEEFHTLIRTINSILERTPNDLLAEIILVDDSSENDIKTKIDEYKIKLLKLKNDFLEKVRYIRTPERAGLIRSRNYGAKFANGRILLFLDSHCEVNTDWLPPLIERIALNRNTVVCPIIDLIDPDTFIYNPSPMVKGGFNWALNFKWDSIPHEDLLNNNDFIKPIKSPAMAGGLFAIDRKYFFELGTYDSGMNIWGGENIEFSLRIWMCGGRLEIIPCSRVGHIFRKRRPYDSPYGQDTLAFNSLRVANVWLDDYKKYYLSTRSDLSLMPYGNIDDRIELRRKLNCKDFNWYLKNIYPELLASKENQNQRKNDKIKNLFSHNLPKLINKYLLQLNGTDLCLQSESELSYKSLKLNLEKCSKASRRQIWKESELNELRIGVKGCLDSIQGKDLARVNKCDEIGSTQKWSHKSKDSTNLYNVGSGTCLAVRSPFNLNQLNNSILYWSTSKENEKEHNHPYKIVMSFCNINERDESDSVIKEPNIYNKWNLIPLS